MDEYNDAGIGLFFTAKYSKMRIIKYLLIFVLFFINCTSSIKRDAIKWEEVRVWEVSDPITQLKIFSTDTLLNKRCFFKDNKCVFNYSELDIFLSKLNSDSMINENCKINNFNFYAHSFKRVNFSNSIIGVLRITASREVGYLSFYYCREYGIIAKIVRRNLYKLVKIINNRDSENIDLYDLSTLVVKDSLLSHTPDIPILN